MPLSVFDASANASYSYATDANKNIAELTDDSGNVVAHYEYSPFGQQTKTAGSYASSNLFRFSSEYYDTETGYYDAMLGRWLSRDPIGEDEIINLNGVVNNSIVNYFDNMGYGISIIPHKNDGKLVSFCEQQLDKKGKKLSTLARFNLETYKAFEVTYGAHVL